MKIKRGAFLLLLTLWAAFVAAVTARAADISNLWIGASAEITAAGAVSDAGQTSGSATVSVEDGSIVIELDNFQFNASGYCDNDDYAPTTSPIYYTGSYPLVIRLTGENIITQADVTNGNAFGLYIWRVGVRFEGGGSLTIKSGNAGSNTSGIYTGGAATFAGCTVKTTGGYSSYNYATNAGIKAGGDVIIDGAEVTAEGGAVVGDNPHSVGISAFSSSDGPHPVIIKSGKLTASGDTSALYYGGDDYRTVLKLGEDAIMQELVAGDSAETATATEISEVKGQKYVYNRARVAEASEYCEATFDGAGAEGAVDAIAKVQGRPITLPANAFAVPTGKLFAGWSDGTTTYQAGESYTLAADVTFSAIWADAVTVTFDSNGGGAVDSQTILINTTATEPKAPVRAGFIFQGWKSDGTSFDFSAPVTGDITLTAAWLEGVRIEEGFESGALPDGWTTDRWSVGTGDDDGGGAHSGDYNARKVENEGNRDNYWLIMPAQDLSGKTVASLSFWYINRDWGSDTDAFGVYYRINGGDWTEIFFTTAAHGWTEWTGNLPAGALVSGVEIGFRMTDNYGCGVGLDDVLLEAGGHSWSYAAEGNVITATCQNDPCAFGDSKSFPLTLNAQDGATVAVTLDGLDAFNDATGLTVSASDIVYYDDGGTALSGVPVNVGIYTAKLTVEGVTAEKTFRITIPVSYLDAAWNETTKTVDYTGKEADCVPVASYMTAWGAADTETWYVVTEDVTIAERVTVTGDVRLILCDGATLTASKGITVENNNQLTVYAQSGGTGTLKATGTSGQEEAGIGAYRSNNGSSNCGTVTIKGGVIEASGGNGAGIGGAGGNSGGGNITIYGGSVTAVGSAMNTGIGSGWRPYGSTSVTIYGGEINATGGERAAGIGGGTSASNITVTIHGGVINATGGATNGAGIGYGDDASGRQIIVAIDGGNVTASGFVAIGSHSNNEEIALTIADRLAVKAGDDAASAVSVATSDFVSSHTQKYAQIAPCPMITAQTETVTGWTYGDTVAEASRTLSVTAEAANGGALSYQWYVVAPEEPGSSSIVVIDDGSGGSSAPDEPAGDPISGATGAAYVIPDGTETGAGTYQYYCVVSEEGLSDTATSERVSLNVAKATPTVTVTANTLTYNGAAQALVTGSTTGGTLYYCLKQDDYYDEETGETLPFIPFYETEIPEGTDAGEYVVLYVVSGDENYNDVAEQSVTVTIAPKTLTVTADAQSKIYGGADPELTFTASGFAGDDTESVISGALTRAEGEDAGTYAVTQGTLSAGDNYEISFTGADFTINKATLTVTAEDKLKTYGEADPELTFTASGFVGDDTESVLSGALSRAEGEDAGTYDITQGILSAGDNYDISFTGADFTINKATLTVTADAQSKTYGEDDPDLSYTTDGLVDGDAITGALSRETGENVGTYAVTQGDLSAGDNYEISFTGAEFTINKATLTVTADAQSKIYGEDDPDLSYTTDGLVDGDTITGALSRETGENVGTYAVTQGDLSAGDNYEISFTGAEFTINKATLTVTADAQSKIYGEDDPDLSYTTDGLVDGDTITGALSRAEGEDIGTYAITQGTLSAGDNYDISFTGASLTILVRHEHDDISFTAWASADSLPASAGNYYLTEDVTLSGTWSVPAGTVNLCLNGHKIDGNNGNNSVIIVESGATLNLYDCGEMKRFYKIDSGSHLGVLCGESETESDMYFTGGCITGGKGSYSKVRTDWKFGGGVFVSGGAFTMNGGYVFGNTVTGGNGQSGGGVFVDGNGVFTMNGGGIIGNYLGNGGGAVGLGNAGTGEGLFIMTGGLIRHNYTSWGTIRTSNGSFTMSGGTICNNTTKEGGGVRVETGMFTMSGGEIHDNAGGGVYVYGALELSGNPAITGNTKDGVSANLWLQSEKTISLTGSLENETPVGVTMATPGVFTSGWSSHMSGKDPADCFQSDIDGYTVNLSDGGEAVLISPTTLDTPPTAVENLTYNGTEQELVTAGAATGGTVQYKLGDSGEYSATIPTAKDAGTYTVYYKVAGNDYHTDTEEASVSVTIGKAALTVTADSKSKTYGDADPDLSYTTDGLADGDTITGTLSRTEGESVGTYAITQGTLSAGDNYDISFTGADFTISKKPVTVSGITATNKPYDGNTDATLNYDNVTFDGIVTGDELTITATGTFESADVGDGKTVTITNLTLSGADADNYQFSETGQQSATTANITANELNVTATGYSGTYDGNAHGIIITKPDNVTVTYSETESGTYGADNPTYTDAGSYTVYYKATQTGANDVKGSATVTISKKSVTVSGITAANKPYDGNTSATLNYDNVTFDGIVTGDELTVTATGTFDSADVGDGKTVTITNLTLSGADVANYQLAETGQQSATTANITANALNVTATGYSGTYDGNAHGITVTAPDDVTVTYSETESGTYSTDNPTYTDAGSYTVYYKATQTGANDVKGSATVTISKKSVTVSGITAANKPYDGNTSATLNYDNVTFAGIVTGDMLTITATGTFESADVGDGKAVTITNLTLSGADVDNYQLSETGQQSETTANITANALSVTASGYSGTYDGNAHGIIVTKPDNVTVTYSETESGTYGADNPTYTDAGSYTVYYKATKTGANDVTGSATVTINKKSVTVSGITATNKPYDGNTDATLNYDNVTFDGIVTGDMLTITATGTFESADVGDGKAVTITNLTLSGADADNYQLAETGQQSETTANITANALSVTASGYSGTYDGNAHGITVTAPDGVTVTYSETESGTYSTDNPTYTDAGSYTVYYKATKTGANDITGYATVTISPKTVSLIWGETSFIYDGAEKLPAATTGGLVDGDACTVTVTGAHTDTGTYSATAESLSNDNYQLPAENTVAFTISEGTMEVVAADYDGVYDNESHSIVVTAPSDASVTYSESADGKYKSDNPAYRNAGSYTVYYKVDLSGFSTVQGSAAVRIAKREVTVSGIAAGNKPWDGNTDAALIFSDVAFDGLLDGDSLTVSAAGEFEDAEIGNGKTVTITNLTLGGVDAGNYRLAETGQQESTKANITPNPLDVTPMGYSGVYDGEFHGVSVTAQSGASVSYSESGDGDYSAVSPEYADAGHYAVFYRVEMEGSETVTGSVAVNIARKEIHISGIAAENKPYDGNTNVTLNYDNVTFDGIITGDELTITATGTFEDAETGNGKTVVITDLTLGGADAGNYQLSETGQQETTTADITALTLDVSAEDWNGVYDGNAHGITVTAPDDVTVTYSKTESGAYSTDNPAYTDAGSYTVYYKVTQTGADDVTGSATVTIGKKPVTVSGITANDKPYDGNTSATLNYDNVTFDGIVNGDTLTVTATGTFDSADVGDGKTVTITNLTLSGADADNYQLAETGQQSETTANITPNALNVTASGYSGTYDGNAHGITVTAPDDVTVTYSETESGTYGADNPTYTDAGSYTVYYKATQIGADDVTGSATVTISKKPVTVSGITAQNKLYDGNTDATLNYDNVTFNGIVTGDKLTITATGTFDSADTGDGKTVTITNLTLSGADADNYRLAETGQQSETTANITANALNVTATGYSGTYDGNAHGITVTASDGVVITYSETENGAYSTDNPTYTDAGEYTVYYKVVGENYNGIQGHETVSISRASVRAKLSLVDRADPSRVKNSWDYGGVPAVPMLTVAFDDTAETLSVVLMGDGETVSGYGMASYSYKLRDAETFLPSTPEEIAVLPAGAYTMRVDIAESRNIPAVSASADFTITKAAHENVLAEAVTLSPGAKNASADLSAYLEDGFSCKVSDKSGNLITGDVTVNGSAVLFDVSDASGTLSGSVSVTVSSANYLDYTVTIPLITGNVFKVRFDSNGGTPITETKNLSVGNAFGLLPVPVRDGCAFDGWHTAKTGGEAVTSETTCNSDVTVFAHWTASGYTVTLLLDGGDLPDGAENWTVSGGVGTANFPSDGDPFVLPEAVRDGYVFAGWTAQNSGNTLAKLKVSIPRGNAENLTYKANWTEGNRSGYASFTKDDDSDSSFLGVQGLTQDANQKNAQTGGAESDIVKALQELACDDDTPLAGNQKKDVSVSMNARVLSESAAQKDETVMRERAEIADASKQIYGGDSTVKLDYLAIDIEKTVSVTTTEGDGTENVNPGVPEKVTESHRVIEIPLRYDLTGRYNPVVIRCHGTASAFRRLAERPAEFGDLDGAYYVSGAGNDAVIYIYSSRFSSYAVTTSGRESYAVFFDTDGGTEIPVQIVYKDEGGHAEKPDDPVKDGNTFKGWRVEKSGVREEFDFDAEIINIDTILYADWEKISESKPNDNPVSYSGGSGGSSPKLTEYVTAKGWEGVYNGASRSIVVSAPKKTTVLYSREENGVYAAEKPSFRDAGEYVVWYQVSGIGYPTVRDFETVKIQRREVTVSGIAAQSKPHDGNTVATLNYNRVKFAGIVKGDNLSVTATGTFEDAEIGDGKTVVITNLTLGGDSAGNYRLADSGQQSETKANITENVFNVTASGFSGVYDGDAHRISVDAPDGVSVLYADSESGIYGATNPEYADAAYYLVYYRAEQDSVIITTGSAAVDIERRPVTVSGLRAKDKPYDGSISAELDYDNVSIDGVITGDRLTVVAEGTFESAEVGDDKTVFVSNITLRGDSAGNYRLADSGQQTETKANITPNVLEVNAENYVGVYDREYHGIRVETPEGVTVTYSEQESAPYSETMPTYRDAGTYTVYYRAEKYGYEPVSGSATVTIYKRPVWVSGISAAGKPYDGNTDATLIFSKATLEGRISGDDISFTASGAFENAESGTDKTVFITNLSLRGADAGNYWIVLNESQSTARADITPNLLQVHVSGYAGVYDGQLHGVSVDAPAGTEIRYAESRNGTYMTFAPSYRNAGEYTVYYRATKADSPAVTGSAVISIEKREVTVSGITAADKPYDGNTSATLNYDNAIISGIVTGDKVTVTASGTFASPDAGKGKTVRITGLTLGGADAGNYRLAARGQQTETNADITRKSYAVTGSIRHEDASGNVSLELLDGNAVAASASAVMTQGAGTYSFSHVPSGAYTLVVTRDDNGQTVTLTMPLRVGG